MIIKEERNFDICIVGAGMVGLSLAYQLCKRNITKKIIIIEKEIDIGLHTSGRNSGVLHSGIYYKPNSLKAKVCVSGAKRLKEWIEERKLPINKCGKLIIPNKEELDSQLDVLLKRGLANGAKVEILKESDIRKIQPEVNCITGRGIWSPNTCVVDPIKVLKTIEEELKVFGVQVIKNISDFDFKKNTSSISLSNGEKINYATLINCSGLHADEIAKKFDAGKDYILLPFKGMYWELKRTCRINIKTNVYPVPDLNVPFLGVHFTPNAKSEYVYIGPTATPAWGRENYEGFNNIDFKLSLNNLKIMSNQYLQNRGGFRKYVHEQAFLSNPFNLINAAKELVPQITLNNIQKSKKVGIRAQLFNIEKKELINDFIYEKKENSIHILNAISPAFTSSFSLADYIIDNVMNT